MLRTAMVMGAMAFGLMAFYGVALLEGLPCPPGSLSGVSSPWDRRYPLFR